MANKTVKTRIQIKRGSAAEWDTASKAATPFKPLNGELIYYTDSKILKIGDGDHTPNDLDVFADGVTTEDLENIPYATSYEGTAGGVAVGAVTLYSETTDDDGNAVVGDPASAGNSQTPVYFDNGKPTACSTLPYAAGVTPGGPAGSARMLTELKENEETKQLEETPVEAGTITNPVFFHDGIPVETNLKYAGSDTAGGIANYAKKILKSVDPTADQTVGNSKTPIYIDKDGTPKAVSGLTLPLDGNAATATKLKNATTLNVNGAVNANGISFNGDTSSTNGKQNIEITALKEAYLSWGGKGRSGNISPLDAAASNLHSANRFAFADPAGISISYSQAGGNFNDYGISATDKTKLVSGLDTPVFYAGKRSKSNAVNDMLRIELNSKTMNVYTMLQKLLINVSRAYCTATVNVQKVTFGGTVTDAGTYEISGWSGWNSIPTGTTYFGYNSSSGNIEKLILTFTITSIDTSYTDNYCGVINIIAIGETYWTTPSNMAKTGHLYSYDVDQKAIFPGKVKSESGFEGTADVATKLGTATVGTSAEPIYLNAGVPTKGKRIPSILTGTSAPTSSQGENGDIYLMPYASNLPAIYSGTAAPQATLGVDGDIYILYE